MQVEIPDLVRLKDCRLGHAVRVDIENNRFTNALYSIYLVKGFWVVIVHKVLKKRTVTHINNLINCNLEDDAWMMKLIGESDANATKQLSGSELKALAQADRLAQVEAKVKAAQQQEAAAKAVDPEADNEYTEEQKAIELQREAAKKAAAKARKVANDIATKQKSSATKTLPAG